MSKAEERALACIPTHTNEGLEKQRKRFREFYVEGYKQAEKDLALTWEDIKFITDEFVFVGLQSNLIPKSEMLYKVVLRRFNEKKNK